MDIKEEFGEIIRRHRKQKGFSQEVLAEKSDISVNQLSLIERGQVNASIFMLFKLARALETKPENLIQDIKRDSD